MVALLILGGLPIFAQTGAVITPYNFGDETMMSRISDNGLYAVTSGVRVVDLTTKKSFSVNNDQETAHIYDISNDGLIVVGAVANRPAFYNVNTNKWTNLATKGDYIYGMASSITPDGKLAAGTLSMDVDGYYSTAALWNLETGELIETPGLPKKDMSHQDQGMIDFRGGISADGKILLGSMSFSYLPSGAPDSGGCCWFVYYRDTQTYEMIGFKESAVSDWKSLEGNISFISEACMSNNGRYISGDAYCTIDDGSQWGIEYDVPYLYDTEKKTFTLYDDVMSQATVSYAVSNTGVITSNTPVGTPVREWSIRHGKYWFSLSEVLKQKYGQDFYGITNYSNTGTVYSISDDGKRVLAFPDPYSSYIIDFPEPLDNICDGIKLLGAYSVQPEEGSQVSHLKNITLTFDRNITTVGGSNIVSIIDEDNNTLYNSIGFSASGKSVNIRFRQGTLEEGRHYELFIPEGAIALADDPTQTNDDIYISYVGRSDSPVKVKSIIPADGSTFSKLDYSTNPVMITFDTNVSLSDDASAVLYRNDEAEPFCSLIMAYKDNQVALYPSTTQYLFNGSTYRIVISAGSVADVAGNNGCEEITISYNGNYERQISSDDVVLFSDNFNTGLGNFMQWCGDKNVPTADMINWDFQQGMAWGLVRDDEASDDRMAASHSMYSPAGKSDDWLVLPQIFVPDALCSLQFLSQSYLNSKKDILKVVVWESDNVYNTLTDDIVAKMKAEGTVIYNKVQSPGANEEVLGGEWTENQLSLADYAGKNIYIAFVNDNEDQSAIFLEDLQVRHEMDFLVGLDYDTRVINKQEASIRGYVENNSSTKNYNAITATLCDAEGNIIDEFRAENQNLTKGNRIQFTFSKTLPLTIGVANEFSVSVACDGEKNEVKGSIDNLVFEPRKHVVLEEYTGRTCGNCPLGILAVERLEARYGEQFLPITIHTYGSDPLGNGLGSYSSYLGLDAIGAPSGTVNRIKPSYPAVSANVADQMRFFFSQNDAPEGTDLLWADYVEEEMNTPAPADVDVTVLDTNASGISIRSNVRYAMDAKGLNVNLLTVLVEDGVLNKQSNYLASTSSPDLGEFGLGGKYGQSTIDNYPFMDVCRNVVGITLNGTSGYVPSSVTAGELYSADIDIPVPSTVQSLENCKVIVIMIDNNTGRVINAARAHVSTEDGVNDVLVDGNNQGIIYNVAGQRVDAEYKGIIINNGKKYIIR